MTTKQLLRQARIADRLVDEAAERAARVRARLEAGRRSSVSGMPRGGGGSDWTRTADQLVTLEARVNARLRELCRLKQSAMDLIQGVDEPRLREVLELYYLDGMTWEQVAERMGYSQRNVMYLHGIALRQLPP